MSAPRLVVVGSPGRARVTAARDDVLRGAGLDVVRVTLGARPAPGGAAALVRSAIGRRRALQRLPARETLASAPELAVLLSVPAGAVHLDGGLGVAHTRRLARGAAALGLGPVTVTLTADDLGAARVDGPVELGADDGVAGVHVESDDLVEWVGDRGPRWVADLPVAAVDAPAPPSGPLGGAGTPLRVAVIGPFGWSAGADTAVRAAVVLAGRGIGVEMSLVGAGDGAAEAAFTAHAAGLTDPDGAVRVVLDPDPAAAEARPEGAAWRAVGAADVVVSADLVSAGGAGPRLARAWGRPLVVATGPRALPPAGALATPWRDPEALATALGRLAGDGEERRALARAASEARPGGERLVATWSAIAGRRSESAR